MQVFLTVFFLQLIDFILICVNFRAVAHLQYVFAVSTDVSMCLLGWTFFKIMQREIDNWVARAAFVLGGGVGSFVGMYITRVWGA